MKLLKYLVPVLALLLVTSCFNDDDISIPENPSQIQEISAIAQNFGASIQRDFFGNVFDLNGYPIANVQITIGSKITTTNNNGVFYY